MSASRRRLSRGLVPLTVASVAGALLLSLTGGSAAQLEVRAVSPLQVFVFDDVDFDPPDEDPVEHDITVIARRFDKGSSPEEVGGSPTETTFHVTDGTTYTLSWSRGSVVECSTLDHIVDPGHFEGIDEEYVAEGGATHEFCVQTRDGDVDLMEAPSGTDE